MLPIPLLNCAVVTHAHKLMPNSVKRLRLVCLQHEEIHWLIQKPLAVEQHQNDGLGNSPTHERLVQIVMGLMMPGWP